MLAALTLMLTQGCERTIETPLDCIDEAPTGKARFTFTPQIIGESGTKAMTGNAQMKNLYVSVFDAAGYKLSEYVEAKPEALAGTNGTIYKYTVDLTVSDSPRILHFIGNAPASLRYGSESEVIGSLFSEYGSDDDGDDNTFEDAYWQRIELPCIPAKPADDDPQYATKQANYELVMDKLNNSTKLIRNYSKVTAKSSAENFTLTGFWFVNYPNKGTVAPYNRNSKRFMDDYLSYTTVSDMEDSGSGKGNYQGFMLATTGFVIPSEFTSDNMIATPGGTGCGYVYEREKALESPLYLIVGGEYKKDDSSAAVTCYYKIAMQNTEGVFYAMLRNFNYLVDITSVGCAGKATAKEALLSAPSGDITVNFELQKLTNISDGDSRLTVSETNVVLVGTNGNSIEFKDFWYKYEADIKNHAGSAYNSPVESSKEPYVKIEVNDDAGLSGPVFDSTTPFEVKSSDEGGLRYVTIHTTAITDVSKTQSMTITGVRWDGTNRYTISRVINFRLRGILDMQLSCGPNTLATGNGSVEDKAGSAVTVSIGIEGGLQSSMFPMDFTIEAANRTLAPDGDVLPVTSGVSTIQDNTATAYYGKPSYWFTKTVTYEEYAAAPMVDGNRIITCHLKTNTNSSATDIYVSNKYFNQEHVSLTNYTASTFSDMRFSKSPVVGETLSFSFDMSKLPDEIAGKRTVNVELKGLEPSSTETKLRFVETKAGGYEVYEMTLPSGSSTNDVTVSLLPYKSGTAEVRLAAYQFSTTSQTVTVSSENEINVPANAVVAYRIKNNQYFADNTQIDVYITDPVAGTPHSVANFTVNGQGKNKAQFTVDASSTVYFRTTREGKYYYAQCAVSDLAAATTASPCSLTFNTNPPTHSVAEKALQLRKAGSNFTNGQQISVYDSDPRTGSPTALATFSTNNESRNNKSFNILCADNATIYFKAVVNTDGTYYGSAKITAMENATNSNGNRCEITLLK